MPEGFDSKRNKQVEKNQSNSGDKTRKGYTNNNSSNRTQIDRINEQLVKPNIQGKAREDLEAKKRKLLGN